MIRDVVDRAVAAVLRDPRSVRIDVADRPEPAGQPEGQPARTTVPKRTDFGSRPTGSALRGPPTTIGSGGITDLLTQLARGERSPADLMRTTQFRVAQRSGIVLDLWEAVDSGQHSAATDRPQRPFDALAGIPIAVKDNIDIAGLITGMGGPVGRHRAWVDAAATKAVRGAGAVLIGHTRMRELAWGVTTPGCPNPWRPGMSPGGSSGGSAAAVASGMVPVALATDTGGSIRIPAALCGVTGLRPTHGVASMGGITGMSADLDTVGPLALSAADCLLVHELMAGPGEDAPESVSGLTVGVLAGWQGRVHPAVEAAVNSAARALVGAGAHLVSVDLGSAGLAASLAYVLMLIDSARLHLAEAEREADTVDAETLEQLRQGNRIDHDPNVRPRAWALATSIRRDVEQALQDHRLAGVLSPVTMVPAVLSDAESVVTGGRTFPVADALSRYTALPSVTGLPALSVPAGLHTGLPVAAQLMGRRRGERTLALLGGVIEAGPGAEVTHARQRLWMSHTQPT